MNVPHQPIPGSYGWPVFGRLTHTLRFLRGWRAYYDAQVAEHGSTVFRSPAGLDAIVVLDQQGLEVMFDSERIDKLYGFGPLSPPPARVGHIVPTVFANGEDHRRQKSWFLALQAQRLPTIYETFDRVATPWFDRWVEQGTFDWGADLDALYSDFLFEYFLGTRPDPADVAGWGYQLLPRNPLRFPGQGDAPVVARMERLLKVIRSAPRWAEVAQQAQELAGLDEDAASKQMLFYLGFNAWTGLGSVTRSAIGEWDGHPAWADRTRAEVRGALEQHGWNAGPLSTPILRSSPCIRNTLRETLRLHQPAPFAYGKARKDFVLESRSGRFEIREGEVIAGVLGYAQRDPVVYSRPHEFVAERFEQEEAQHGLVWAHGRETSSPSATDKMCAGRDVVYLVLHQFLARLLGGYRYQLAERPVIWSDVKLQPANRPVTPILAARFERAAD